MSGEDIIIHVNLACLCELCVALLPGSPLLKNKNKWRGGGGGGGGGGEPGIDSHVISRHKAFAITIK